MTYREAILEAGRAYLTEVLTQTKGDVAEAAKLAGLSRTGMYKLLPKYGIELERTVKISGWAAPVLNNRP